MQLQLIRNATMRITYAGHLFIVDPFLAEKHAIEAFDGNSPNPLVDLPCSPQEAVADVEMVLVSHLHIDHFDPSAQELLSKNTSIFCQPGDENRISDHGFQHVTPIEERLEWKSLTLTRTPGQHGTGIWIERMGNVSGFFFQAADEPTVYWTGDTIWYPPVGEIIKKFRPDIIITHSSGAKFGDSDPIVMDAEQTIAVSKATPDAVVIAVHMESLDHCTVTREALRSLSDQEGIPAHRLLIPADGETLTL